MEDIVKGSAMELASAKGSAKGWVEGWAKGYANECTKSMAESIAAGMAESMAESIAAGMTESMAKGHAIGYDEGHSYGHFKGYVEGHAEMLLQLMRQKFAVRISKRREAQVQSAMPGQLKVWAARLLDARNLKAVFDENDRAEHQSQG